VDAQVQFARFAHSRGASWLILQPPPDRGVPEDFFIRFFGAVSDRVELPVAIQNAPAYLGVGLTPSGVKTLAQGHPNVRILKAEGPALCVHEVIEEAGDRVTVFNGRGGLELIDNLRAGCAGLIPASDTFDRQARIFDLLRSGADTDAEALYREVLPAIVFVMQSLDTLHTYGKRIAAMRLGLGEVFDRTPALQPNVFGMQCAQRYAAALGPFA
ncbi:MAG: dihydrodipicolinate synthase family protein, partial [Betaproteobacteria bacterium]